MKIINRCTAAALIGAVGLTFTSCDEDTVETVFEILDAILTTEDDTTIKTADGTYLGWLENDEDPETIEDDIDLNGVDNDLSKELPSKVDLSKYLPPIGDQGQYGTCVAWATAYNGRTWLYAKSNNKTTNQLTNSDIFSPADVFMAIDDSKKGKNCEGTNIRYAFDVMQQRGVATQATVPYSNLDCSCAPSQSANSDAQRYKIKAYREININDVETVKRYLANGRLIVFGARLGDEFMYSKDATVLTKQTSFKSTGMHGYHALVCVGYDDTKGSNGAFRVANSWDKTWGDNGFIWVDQKFFCNKDEFAYAGFVLYGLDEEIVVDETNNTAQNTSANGPDLVPHTVADYDYDEPEDPDSNDPRWRSITYNIYNAGNQDITPSEPWAICYMLYNAYKADEYTFLLVDLYTDKFGKYTDPETNKEQDFNPNWDEKTAREVLGVEAQGYCWSNVTVKAHESVSHAVYGNDDAFDWGYKMPNVTGSYYLVMISDAFNGVAEDNEDNNFYFLTSDDGKPLQIKNGIIKSTIKNSTLKSSKLRTSSESASPTAVTEQARNTYTPKEISVLINAHRRSGKLKSAAMDWYNNPDNKPLAKKRKPHVEH